MPAGPRPRRDPTDDWDQLRLVVASPAQETYELLRPIVLFGHSIPARAQQTGVPERTLRRKVARCEARGMRSLFDLEALAPPTTARRQLPPDVRRAIVDLKAEYPPLGLREIATICRLRFDRPVSHHTVRAVLASEPLPIRPPRRFPRYRETADSVARRRAVVTLSLDGWSAKAIAGYLETSRQTVYEVLRRWDEEGWPGLSDRPYGPRHPARKVDLRAMAAIRRLQANPELGEFRIHAALAQPGIHLSPSTCGRLLALHRALGAPRPAPAIPHEPQPMPFAAQRRHQSWSVDIRSIEEHRLGTGKPVSVLSILEHVSRAILAGAISPRQDLTASRIVLRAAVEARGAPEVLVSDGGGVFRAKQAHAVYAALGIQKERIDAGQAWQHDSEPHCTAMRRMADHHDARAATWGELQAVHDRFFHDDNHHAHVAHRGRTDGRGSPAAVLGWVQGAWCGPADRDRRFRLRATRRLNAHGCVRFRHWRRSGERGLAGDRVAVWVWDETVTVADAAETLAEDPVTVEAAGQRRRDVGEPRLSATGHASPPPFLSPLDAVAWHPARRLAPARPRRPRAGAGPQARRFDPDPDARTG